MIGGITIQFFLIFGILCYFIWEQFSFGPIKKINYFFLPLFSIVQFCRHFTFSNFNGVILLVIVVASIVVGYFQAKYSTIREEKIPTYYYKDKAAQEKAIYKKQLCIKGGAKYVLGWVIIFALQIVLQVIITSSHISSQAILGSFMDELLSDLLFVYRLYDLNESKSTWYVWALYGVSSLSYTIFLARKFPKVKKKLFGREILEDE